VKNGGDLMPKSLIETMSELVSVHEQLLEITTKKKDILIEGNIDALSKLIPEESKLVRSLGKLEEERMFQIKQFLQAKGLEAEGFTLVQLLQLISDKADRDELNRQAIRLQELIQMLKTHNELNARLIADSLHYVNQSIELLTDTRPDQINYQAPSSGKTPVTSAGRSFFDTKA